MFVDGVIHCEKGSYKWDWVEGMYLEFEVLRVVAGVYDNSR